ncbi:hypothetical protein MTO96_029695 [Rhipicephalus appendiculatus]
MGQRSRMAAGRTVLYATIRVPSCRPPKQQARRLLTARTPAPQLPQATEERHYSAPATVACTANEAYCVRRRRLVLAEKEANLPE